MGPVRGFRKKKKKKKKKKKRAEKRAATAADAPPQGSGDWWDEFSSRISGFPLLPWLLTPYRGKDLSHAEVEFSSRLTASGLLAQRAFARLKDMWKIIHGEMRRPDRHRLPRIILVCCLLHNIAIDMEDEVINTLNQNLGRDRELTQSK